MDEMSFSSDVFEKYFDCVNTYLLEVKALMKTVSL